jgi:hypothetical protein
MVSSAADALAAWYRELTAYCRVARALADGHANEIGRAFDAWHALDPHRLSCFDRMVLLRRALASPPFDGTREGMLLELALDCTDPASGDDTLHHATASRTLPLVRAPRLSG